MRAGIQEDALRVMLKGGAVREVLVSRHNEKWTLAIRLGGAGCRYARAARRCVPGKSHGGGTLCRGYWYQDVWCRAVESHCEALPL